MLIVSLNIAARKLFRHVGLTGRQKCAHFFLWVIDSSLLETLLKLRLGSSFPAVLIATLVECHLTCKWSRHHDYYSNWQRLFQLLPFVYFHGYNLILKMLNHWEYTTRNIYMSKIECNMFNYRTLYGKFKAWKYS